MDQQFFEAKQSITTRQKASRLAAQAVVALFFVASLTACAHRQPDGECHALFQLCVEDVMAELARVPAAGEKIIDSVGNTVTDMKIVPVEGGRDPFNKYTGFGVDVERRRSNESGKLGFNGGTIEEFGSPVTPTYGKGTAQEVYPSTTKPFIK